MIPGSASSLRIEERELEASGLELDTPACVGVLCLASI